MARILVVDDNHPNREYLVTLLGYGGHELRQASDGAEALIFAQAERPDLVISDLLMPTMDGFEFARRLRSDPTLEDVPMIFYTAAYHLSQVMDLARDCGARCVLQKPVKPETVLRAVNEALGISPASAGIPSPEWLKENQPARGAGQLVSDLNTAQARLSALVELGLELSVQRDLRLLLDRFCHSAREIVGTRLAIVALVGTDGMTAQEVFTSGMDPTAAAQVRKASLPPEIRDPLLVERRTLRIRNSGPEGAAALQWPGGFPAASALLGVPIVSPTGVYGWLVLLDKITGEEFSEEDQRLAAILGAQVGRIYESGSLHAQLRAAHSEMECRVKQRTAELIAANVELRNEVAERERMQEELRQAREAAVQASRAKSEFLAMMSHELRTPLNGVTGMTELLLGTSLSPEQRRFGQIAKASADTLLGLINGVLDFSKIEAGKLDLECIDFDLRSTVQETVAGFSPTADSKRLVLEARVEPDVPSRLCGDPVRLKQILANLVGNALKFTERGKVTIEAALDGESAQRATVRFSVRDTGPGIPRDRLAVLFQCFSQVDASTTRKYGGTGLGLAICKRLAELMGGRIGVESEVGKGSTFYFTAALEIPTAENAAQPQAGSQTEAETPIARVRSSGRGTRILVAEDDEINQLVALEMLSRAGYQCAATSSGSEAVEAVMRSEFDLVLMDCRMPEMDGFAAARAIRAAEAEQRIPRRERAGRLPIIALTANVTTRDRDECLDAGMDDYLTKPLNSNRLIEVIEAHLARASRASSNLVREFG